MESTAHLERILHLYQVNPPIEDLRIQGWRFALNDQTVVKTGIRDNKLGEVDAAPSFNKSCSGDLLVIWPDDFCSHAQINPSVINAIEAKLPLWKKGAYRDPEGSVLLEQQPLPLTAVEDQKVKQLVTADSGPIFEPMNRFRQELPAWGIASIHAGIEAGWGLRHIRTSKGLAVSYAQTSYSTYVLADGLYGRNFAKRRLPTDVEIQRLVEYTGKTVQLLKVEASIQAGKTSIVLAPELVESFTAKYLLTNLSGNNTVHQQGAYTLEDFRQGKQVFDPRISVRVNPLKPFELSSYLCTGEGLPASSLSLVDKGKLSTPFLTVKDSIKAGFGPTPLPQGSGLWLECQEAKSMEEMIRGIDEGILVFNVLGLHTQDSTRGSYAVSAPHCLKIEAGKFTGSVRTVISGNFLDHLADSATGYGIAQGENFPAMKITANVQPQA